jgi:hypothetical protein
MPKSATVRVRIELVNPEAVAAFAEACRLVTDAAEDYPWSEDLREAREQLRIAAEQLTGRVVR